MPGTKIQLGNFHRTVAVLRLDEEVEVIRFRPPSEAFLAAYVTK